MVDLMTPRVRVVIEQDDSDDYLEYDVLTDNRDMIQWDVTRARRDWPLQRDASMLWMSFLAWHALRRTGVYKDSLDTFLGVLVQVQGIDKEGRVIGLEDKSDEPEEAWGEDHSRKGPART